MTVADTAFSVLCRRWRRLRHLSQLELAETAAISQRHLSWLETGRSKPSRDMVLRLAAALEMPLRERNVLLHSAGFSVHYRESALSEPHMTPILLALDRVLSHHMPFPAVVVDRKWNCLKTNAAANAMFELAGANAGDEPLNLAVATLEPDGFRRHISNWQQALPLFVQRLRSEALASADRAVLAHAEALIRSAGELPELSLEAAPLLPVMPLELRIDTLELSLFTVMSTFGTPQDVTTDELRVEAFYPADDATRAFFEELVRE